MEKQLCTIRIKDSQSFNWKDLHLLLAMCRSLTELVILHCTNVIGLELTTRQFSSSLQSMEEDCSIVTTLLNYFLSQTFRKL